ncbi:lysine histidine transporter [Marchantia polymorpha subsp. ruderalis]|uniref:Amino acid transporter transmembrane domain-containing protein n=2 Tax=Marchantia polymorpha TaxID=3197 RepID=A0A176VIF1_MARPO|nr:hypothetical protein AXG93_544s1050 [Marchantia polymorpha subsp. ruderalis]PTQ31774.1 hypothetical protein MARPO_0107s0041 [Marchantia polymorpha]BBN00446.1 hypothetical protein Mp_1g29260 [Marchantia polymorpha subsp. ruderalis]|eukprot:PTQ31774.1 hypothetical protein MARPO_0107s0041 [Marchantia polymorpha]
MRWEQLRSERGEGQETEEMDSSSGGEGSYGGREGPRVVTVREVSFAPNVRSEVSSRSDEPELISIPVTPQGSTPPSQASPRIFSPGILTPSGAQTPRGLALGAMGAMGASIPGSSKAPSSLPTPSLPTPKTPWTPGLRSPRFLGTPLATPMRRAFVNMKQYLEDIGHFTTLNPRDAWLPVTESRNGNVFYAAFHTLNASIGFQSLFLPVAFMYLGWTWGSLALTVAFVWQMYTTHLLVMMHESVPGKRLNRFIEIAQEAFGPKRGLLIVIPPLIQLSAGYCVALTILGGSALQLFYSTVCTECFYTKVLTVMEWYLVFTCLCWVVALLPNLNSISYVSLVGSIMAVAYCTLLWAISVDAGRPLPISYDAVRRKSDLATAFTIFVALGNVVFAFRGHNLIPEIQATMPSSLKNPAHVPMWRGVRIAFVTVAICLFPIAIAGYWAYGDKMLPSGILFSLYHYHVMGASRVLIGMTFLMVALHAVTTYQIYAMQQFDFFEMLQTMRSNRPVPWWLRLLFRSGFVFFNFFAAVALPFISSLAGFLGGISSIPISFAFPCFMWLWIKKPSVRSFDWYLNWTLGIFGICLSLCVSVSGIWSIVDTGLRLNFFRPGET